jgi:hypothetical protein
LVFLNSFHGGGHVVALVLSSGKRAPTGDMEIPPLANVWVGDCFGVIT